VGGPSTHDHVDPAGVKKVARGNGPQGPQRICAYQATVTVPVMRLFQGTSNS
jgi:hypothetical protein